MKGITRQALEEELKIIDNRIAPLKDRLNGLQREIIKIRSQLDEEHQSELLVIQLLEARGWSVESEHPVEAGNPKGDGDYDYLAVGREWLSSLGAGNDTVTTGDFADWFRDEYVDDPSRTSVRNLFQKLVETGLLVIDAAGKGRRATTYKLTDEGVMLSLL